MRSARRYSVQGVCEQHVLSSSALLLLLFFVDVVVDVVVVVVVVIVVLSVLLSSTCCIINSHLVCILMPTSWPATLSAADRFGQLAAPRHIPERCAATNGPANRCRTGCPEANQLLGPPCHAFGGESRGRGDWATSAGVLLLVALAHVHPSIRPSTAVLPVVLDLPTHDVLAFRVFPLQQQGCVFGSDGKLTEAAADELEMVKVDNCFIAFVPPDVPGCYPEGQYTLTPVYYNTTRERLLTSVCVPITSDEQKWVRLGAALFIKEL